MKQIMCIGLFTMMSLTASQVYASPLAQEMKTMSQQLKAFDKAKDETKALSALNQFQMALNNAKAETPRKLNSQNASDLQAYHTLFDDLNAEVEQAKALIEAGKIAEAKKLIKNMKKIAGQGHCQYR